MPRINWDNLEQEYYSMGKKRKKDDERPDWDYTDGKNPYDTDQEDDEEEVELDLEDQPAQKAYMQKSVGFQCWYIFDHTYGPRINFIVNEEVAPGYSVEHEFQFTAPVASALVDTLIELVQQCVENEK